MKRPTEPTVPKSVALIALMLVQAFCAVFFLGDLIGDMMAAGRVMPVDLHATMELVANFGLIAGVGVEAHYLLRLLRRQALSDRALSVASGALADVIDAYFTEWGLTPSEADIANFTIKGFSIAEVARMRGSAEGTVKTHLNAIYRKAGVAGRSQLVSLLIEDLLNGKLGGAAPSQTEAAPGRPAAAAS